MTDPRSDWLETIERFRWDPTEPGSERFWSPRLDTISRDELHTIQSEKLRAAVRYAYACIPFYRRRFDAGGLHPDDIRSRDDLDLIPIATRQEMAHDLTESPPWGTY